MENKELTKQEFTKSCKRFKGEGRNFGSWLVFTSELCGKLLFKDKSKVKLLHIKKDFHCNKLFDFFEDPLYPTETEALLFELEFGFRYPLDERNLVDEDV